MKIGKHRTSVSCFTQKSKPEPKPSASLIKRFDLFWLVSFCFERMNGDMNCATLCG